MDPDSSFFHPRETRQRRRWVGVPAMPSIPRRRNPTASATTAMMASAADISDDSIAMAGPTRMLAATPPGTRTEFPSDQGVREPLFGHAPHVARGHSVQGPDDSLFAARPVPDAGDFSDVHDQQAEDDQDEQEQMLGQEEELTHDAGDIDVDELEGADTTYNDQEDDSSSAAFDPDEDPESWAERLDELAGVLEMSEGEARALRWGPAIGQEWGAPDLSREDFRALLDHHLTTTEWRFDCSVGAGAMGMSYEGIGSATGAGPSSVLPGLAMPAASHPIRVLGRAWVGYEAGL